MKDEKAGCVAHEKEPWCIDILSEETRMQQALGKSRHRGPSAMGAVSFMLGNKTLKYYVLQLFQHRFT